MVKMHEETGVSYFRFYDDLFTAKEDKVLSFCRLLREKNLPIRFRVLVRAGTSMKVLKALKDAGCIGVGFGIESGSNRILSSINKKITTKMVFETIRRCRAVGLWTIGSFIVSFENETMEDYRMTRSLCRHLDLFQTNIQILFPYTPFYRTLKKRDEIDDSIWFDRSHDGRILYTKDLFPSAPWNYRDLKWMALRTYYEYVLKNPGPALRFYGRNRFVFHLIKALVDFPTRGRMDHLWKVVRRSPA